MSLAADVRLARGEFKLDVRLTVEPRQTVAVLGPNGAGKSTLLRALAGLDPIESGRIVIDDIVVDDPTADVFVPPERRRVGVVFQQYLLFPHLTALDNVAFGLIAQGASKRDARRSAHLALDAMDIAAVAARKPGSLSGGEAQRVALARALVTRPAALLLDEPFAALDVSTRVATRREVVTFLDAYDGVRMIVTHDPVEAASMADDIVVIEQGRIVQRGTPSDLAAQPRSRYVADLAGVNFVAGRARAGVIDVGGTALVAADVVDGDVIAVIHPRAVVLHRDRPEGTSRNVWQGRVVAVDPEGERVRVSIDAPLPLVAEVTAPAAAGVGAAAGATIWVSVKATEVVVAPR